MSPCHVVSFGERIQSSCHQICNKLLSKFNVFVTLAPSGAIYATCLQFSLSPCHLGLLLLSINETVTESSHNSCNKQTNQYQLVPTHPCYVCSEGNPLKYFKTTLEQSSCELLIGFGFVSVIHPWIP